MRALTAILPLVGALLTLGAIDNKLVVQSASVMNMVPGASLLRDLTYATLDTLNGALDATLGRTLDQMETLCSSGECKKDPDTKRNVSEIIRSRGFEAEEYNVVTKDGYVLTIQRIVNPLVKAEYRNSMKPVIMQHGLMSSSVDWVINSFDVRPAPFPSNNEPEVGNNVDADANTDDDDDDDDDNDNDAKLKFDPLNVGKQGAHERARDSQEHPNSLGFYLANNGYDVFLANSRGNIYGQKHINMSAWEPKFWDFTFDEQIEYDLPDTIEFVQKLTNHKKVGYVGHSQGTAMVFGLLSEKPDYADIIEPVVTLAPVAYVDHSISPVKYFAVYTPIFQHVNMWFATSNIATKYLAPIVCGPEIVRKDICANIVFLSVGFNEGELDEDRVSAYLAHMPSGTSVKNIAHYGQEILSGRFAKFDHGILGNQMRYGQTKSPDYDLSKIRSKSLALFIADNDWLASPKDVARLRKSLTVEPYVVHNLTEYMPKWNHIDFVYGKHAGELVNPRIFDIFQHFNNQ